MSRLCMRPGCDRDAATRLTYDPISCEVWLDDLAERVGRHQEICSMHAERLTVPRGWVLSDRRSPEPTMFVSVTSEQDLAAPSPRRRRRRRRDEQAPDAAAQTLELFETLRQELAAVPSAPEPVPEPVAEPEPEPEPVVAEPEPVVAEIEPVVAEIEPVVAEIEPEPVAEPAPDPDPVPDPEQEPAADELPASLRATSPLLSRAFAATGHQRSVLTQRGPQDPTED